MDPDDFGYSVESINKARTIEFLNKMPESFGTVKGNPAFRSEHSGLHGGKLGTLAVLSRDKLRTLYVVEYVVESPAIFEGHETVTQIKVWKDKNFQSNIASTVIKKLVQRYIVLSDINQTELGKNFWIRIMKVLLEQGYTVGLLDGTKALAQLYQCPGLKEYPSWIEEHKFAWGYKESVHTKYRFFISK